MKKVLLLLVLSMFTTAYAQIRFEKGYLINNNGERSEILLKNEDWSLNPTEFLYKKSEDGAEMTGKIKDIKEFGVNNFSKYVKYTGLIDTSTDNLQHLTDTKEPILVEQTVFLKQLVSGKRNLFVYNDSKVRKYFFSDENTPPTELMYKRYYSEGVTYNVYTNTEYQSQLKTLFYGENADKAIDKIQYKEQSLIKLFEQYNGGAGNTALKSDANKSKVNLYIKPGIALSSASINFSEFSDANVKFENKISPRISVELEYVLPFNKNKLAVFIEPTYQSYKQTGYNFTDNKAEINYSAIELPIGIRYYMFINNDSKIFLEGVANIAELKTGDNTIRYAIPGTSSENIVDLKAKINFGVGIGYNFKNKYSITVRQYAAKNLSENFQYLNLKYNNFSIMAAYNIF